MSGIEKLMELLTGDLKPELLKRLGLYAEAKEKKPCRICGKVHG